MRRDVRARRLHCSGFGEFWPGALGLACATQRILPAYLAPRRKGRSMPEHEESVARRCNQDAGILQASNGKRWFVLHTRSRQEKALCEDMVVRGISHYLPLVPRTHFCGRRKVIAQVPLFAGYVFLLGSIEQAYGADRTGRVARIITVFDQDRMNWELRNLQVAIQGNAMLEIYPNLQAGARVEVRSGPFRGLQGIIENRARKRDRLYLEVSTLGKSVSLEIDGSLLDLVD
jgi:transcription antitermination factor NusG